MKDIEFVSEYEWNYAGYKRGHELSDYLNKVFEYENRWYVKLWRKLFPPQNKLTLKELHKALSALKRKETYVNQKK